MKHILIRAGVVPVALGIALASCSDDNFDYGAASGRAGTISPMVSVDTQVTVGRAARAATIDDVSVSDLSLRLTAASGAFTQTWTSVDDFDPSHEFTVGDYTMEAFYGSLEDEGFEKPYVYGSANLTVKANEATKVSLAAKLANSMVSVAYTPDFRQYFPSYSARVHTTGGAYLDYAASETRPLYIKPGDVELFVTVTKPGSGKEATIKAADIQAKAAFHHKITVDVNPENGGAAPAQLLVSFDDDLNPTEPIVIDLTDELFNTPAPQVTLLGATHGVATDVTEGSNPFQQLHMDIIAMGGIKEATLTTSSASLITNGWPAEINLAEASAAQQSAMSALGFVEHGLWKNPGKAAVVDLKGVVDHLTFVEAEGSPNKVKFTLVVTDANSKASDPVEIDIDLYRLLLQTTVSEAPRLYTRTISASITTSLTSLDGVTMQINRGDGNWVNVPYTAGAAVDGTFPVTVTADVTTETFQLRACKGAVTGAAASVTSLPSADSITLTEAGVWATKAYVTYTTAESARAAIRASRTARASRSSRAMTDPHILWIKQDGGQYAPATLSPVEGNAKQVLISGLQPATKYFLKVTDPENSAELGPEVSFTTETATPLPNGDFEELVEEINVTDQLQGGEYTRVLIFGGNMQNHQSLLVKRPQNWATTNATTYNKSAANQNSWFVVASVFNTSLEWTSKVATQGGMGGQTGKPAPYNLSGISGNSMVIRNVAYSASGTTPELHKKTAVPDGYYNENKPEISDIAAGKLFLSSNGTATGIGFASRPASLSGKYLYSTDSQDTEENGVVTVRVMNGSTEIGRGTASLAAASEATTFRVNISYSNTSLKATSLQVEICSSNRAASAIKVTKRAELYLQEAYGAVLTVDALSLSY